MFEFSLPVVLIAAFGLAMGGVSKGFVGLGLPLVAVPVLTLVVDVPMAIALVIGPILVSNVWQTSQGGQWRPALARFWPLVAMQPFGTVAGVAVLAWADPRLVAGLLGAMVVTFSVLIQVQPEWRVSPGAERLAKPLVGVISGVLGGLSSFLGSPVAMLLFALRLEKDAFIGAVGLTFGAGTLSLLVVMSAFGLLQAEHYALSALAVLPVLAGMWVGRKLQNRISETRFRMVLMTVLIVIGLNLLRRAVFG